MQPFLLLINDKRDDTFCCVSSLYNLFFLFCFFFCNLRFLFGNHFGELDFALLSRFGVDVELLPLAVWQSWIEAAFPEMIVDLIDASRTALTDLSRDRLGMWLCGVVRCVYGRICVQLGCLLYLGHLGVRAADLAVDIHRRLHLHRVGHMAVDVKGSEHQKSSHLMGRL